MKQLEYTWARSLCDAYCDFATLTKGALDFAAEQCGGISQALRNDLIAAYQQLDAYPDVRPTLLRLRERGY